MTKFGGWQFPKGEAHLPGWMQKVGDWRDDVRHQDRRLLYQGKKYRAAVSYCKQRRYALDVGGHVGLWSWMMALDFNRVWAFEPMPEHRECYEINMRNFKNWTLFPFALGAAAGNVHVRTRTVGSSGDTGVDLSGQGLEVPIKTVDEFKFNEIDFMKIDCEGFELFVVKGAEETIKRNKPVMIVEQKPETGMEKNYKIGTKDAVNLLKSWGAREVHNMADDHILVWD